MTVRDAVSVLTEAKQLYICWEGNLTKFDPTDGLMLDAFGNYMVKRICGSTKDDEYEIAIAAVPVRVVEA